MSQHRDAIQEVAETEFYAQFDYKPRTNHVRARARSKRMVKFSRACISLPPSPNHGGWTNQDPKFRATTDLAKNERAEASRQKLREGAERAFREVRGDATPRCAMRAE